MRRNHFMTVLGVAWLPSLALAKSVPKIYVNHFYPNVTSQALQDDITTEGLMGNLAELYQIALDNDGNRAFGLPGYEASGDFIWSRISGSDRVIASKQDFPGLFNDVTSITLTVNDEDYYVYGLTYSPSTSEEGMTAEMVFGPTGEAGCAVDGYEGYDVEGKIVLAERGPCPDGTTLSGRVRPAAAAGAVGIIIYNSSPGNVTAGTLVAPDPDFVPAGFINMDDGEALRSRLAAGEELTAHFQQTQLIETRISQNFLAETKAGDPNNVIMLGAHLDSVKAGPGINDDGSGTSLILELFTALEKYNIKNKVRFAWWGAEENGLVGSTFYTDNLNTTQADKILAYLNFDMVSRGYFGVFDGDGSTHGLVGPPGSGVIEELFVEDLTSKGIEVTPAEFSGGSDYATFMENLEIAVGGLHTGTGIEQDPCYHQPCDTYDNVNATVLTINAKAAAHVLATLAMVGDELIPKSNSTSERSAMPVAWTQFEDQRHVFGCGHEI
ncbi:hypothetical protein BDY21DRAFT_387602 [Lineolata rhizophorae]|uniref:Peptide hydrolase n=1 Tax=Lineolata rhizophorae TaxID=578093 RepID=A0A6A6NSW6_9PEZI|nr:hypothetical protein BDY21DRAFT_387602 [Lineolata rhizophorae]